MAAERRYSNQFLPQIHEELPPEVKLWAEVIRQAVRDAVRLVRRRSGEHNYDYAERAYQRATARDWLYGPGCRRLLAELGIEPEYFYKRLGEVIG